MSPLPPEIPHPGAPPVRRSPTGHCPPPPQPAIDEPLAQLRAQRRLLLTGPIDDPTATRICAELMLLDGQGDGPVDVIINSAGGPVAPATAVTDVIALMRAPVRTRCIGTAMGMAAVVLASGTAGRTATSHATISLRVDDPHEIDGRATDIRRAADLLSGRLAVVAEHLASVCALSVDAATVALRDGQPLTASEALRIGVVDEVTGT